MSAFVRACALACALGPDLEAAAERLSGEPLAPSRDTGVGGEWPYFPILFPESGWMARAEAIAQAVAADLRRKAALSPGEWAALPCFIGSSSNGVGAWDEGGWPALLPPLEFGRRLAEWFGVGGTTMVVNTACTSGLSALDIAASLVEEKRFHHALVLGVELANRLTVAGFAGLAQLSPAAARPCDRARDGLVLGEAFAAVLVSRASAPWRIAALASGLDAASLTGSEPDRGVITGTMRAALAKARWTPADVDLVKLQAGGLPGDAAEARAIRELFGSPPRAFSLKGAIGHTLGASGPAELALTLASLERGRAPATWGFAEPDPELGLVPSGGDAKDVRRVLFNLSGFGGNVMSLALERAG
jgi:3-oxoacyl-[acyl-carrier-protein] synthase-1